jgi:hypothetical protein
VPRTILIHLNVEAADADERNADEIGDLILGALEVGLEGAPDHVGGGMESGTHVEVSRLKVSAPLVEEV